MFKEMFSTKRILYYVFICCVSFTSLAVILSTLNFCIEISASIQYVYIIEWFSVCSHILRI